MSVFAYGGERQQVSAAGGCDVWEGGKGVFACGGERQPLGRVNQREGSTSRCRRGYEGYNGLWERAAVRELTSAKTESLASDRYGSRASI